MPTPLDLSLKSAPQVLPPKRRTKALSDEHLDLIAHVLDDWFRIPGTSIRFGLDGIVGLIPGIGDVLAGLASCILIVAAWIRGVPYITLVRMVINLSIGVVVGAIPIFGDIFDIAWKANRRNLKLMQRHLDQPHKHTWKDWLFLWAMAAALLGLFMLPLIMLAWLVGLFFGHMGVGGG